MGELITEALYVKKEREGDCPAVGMVFFLRCTK